MSSISSAASADSVSDSKERGCAPSSSAKSIPSAEASSHSTGPTSHATTTSGPSTLPLDLPMLSAEDSPARTSVSPARALESPTALAPDYGRSTPELLARFDRDTSSWRTSQLSLLGGLTEYSETWPRSGLMQSGTAYRLPPLVPLTDATESGLLPTPAATSYGSNQGGAAGRVGPVRESLDTMARHGTLPTPRCCNGLRSSGMNRTEILRAVTKWPTPTARDWKGGSAAQMEKSRSEQLNDRVAYTDGGPLNPTWVEWLMGFPLEWTACAAWVTRLSRRSRKSSAEPS